MPDPDGDRASGFDDTIVPVGFLYFLSASTFCTTSALLLSDQWNLIIKTTHIGRLRAQRPNLQRHATQTSRLRAPAEQRAAHPV